MNDMTAAPLRLLMNFEVTPTSHLLADYQARGGYAPSRRRSAR
jgi:hypothetical protein